MMICRFKKLMKRTLSSIQTPFQKFIIPALWATVWLSITFSMLFDSATKYDLFSVCLFQTLGLTIFAFIYRACARLKKVSIDKDFLYVSNYLREITIPLSQISNVKETVWTNIHPVTIYLSSPTVFGDEIRFMPPARFYALFSSHPVVNEIVRLAKSKGASIP